MKNKEKYIWNKYKILLLIFIGIFSVSVIAPIIAKAETPNFKISMSATPESAEVRGDIIVNGTIQPKDIQAQVKDKEVVLVLDISGSMTTKKREELKNSTKAFIDKMKDVPNLKIGVIAFGTKSIIRSKLTTEIKALNDDLNNNNIDGGTDIGAGTNLGGALRQAAYLLFKSDEQNRNANKTIVLMTDGSPRGIYLNNEEKDNSDDYDYNTSIEVSDIDEKNFIQIRLMTHHLDMHN